MMRLWTSLLCLLLCLSLTVCFTGCDQTPDATEPPVETQPPMDPQVLYATARQAVESAADLRLVISMEEQHFVGDTAYIRSANTIASYSGLHTEGFAAVIEENLTFGSYENNYKTYYTDGIGYAQILDYAFRTAMTPEEFLAEQIPAVLVDASLYGKLTDTVGVTGTTLRFTEPTALESWVTTSPDAQLISAEATALVNKAGRLLSTGYRAKYKIGQITYDLTVTVTVSTPNSMVLSDQFPETLGSAASISCFTAPRLLLQAVGDICATQDFSAAYAETLYCEAADSIRKQQVQVSTQGTGDSYSAFLDYTTTLTNYAGKTEINTQKETYENGTYTYSLNDSVPTILQNVTIQQMRTYCEDTVLSALLSIDYLSGAVLIDNGDTYKLQLTATEAMAEDLCDSIYTIINMDLDATAESYSTKSIGGYLILDKATGLPLEACISLSRTHVLGGTSYSMTYELRETITLNP